MSDRRSKNPKTVNFNYFIRLKTWPAVMYRSLIRENKGLKVSQQVLSMLAFSGSILDLAAHYYFYRDLHLHAINLFAKS